MPMIRVSGFRKASLPRFLMDVALWSGYSICRGYGDAAKLFITTIPTVNCEIKMVLIWDDKEIRSK